MYSFLLETQNFILPLITECWPVEMEAILETTTKQMNKQTKTGTNCVFNSFQIMPKSGPLPKVSVFVSNAVPEDSLLVPQMPLTSRVSLSPNLTATCAKTVSSILLFVFE